MSPKAAYVLWRGEKYAPRGRHVVKKLVEGERRLRNALIASRSPVSRASPSRDDIAILPFCFLRVSFLFLILARSAADHSLQTSITTSFQYLNSKLKNGKRGCENGHNAPEIQKLECWKY